MKAIVFLSLSFAAISMLGGQEPAKPADPKVPVHSPEQSALNQAKQDARNKESLKKAKAIFDKATHKTEAAKKEIERDAKSKTLPSADKAKAELERLKNSLDPDDIKEFKRRVAEELKKGQEALKERMKKEDKPVPEGGPVPVPEADPVPGSFENSSPQELLPVRKPPVFKTAPVGAAHIIGPMTRDPNNPDVELPESDPRTRTYVMTGNATGNAWLRQPDMALDADSVTIVFKEGMAPGKVSQKSKKSTAGDPVKPGKKTSNIESLVARGRVRFMYVDESGRVQAGRCGYLIFEEKSGLYILKDWPEVEAGGRLLRGPKKDSVMRMSRTQPPEALGCELFDLDRELVPADVPKSKETPVPPARPQR